VQRSYGYDAAGQITSQTDTGSFGTRQSSFSCDEAGQLIAYTPATGSGQTFTYDTNGNRRSQIIGGVASSYSYVEGNPVSLVDPLGLATYMCTQPLHALGAAGRAVYSPSVDPLYHQFIGIIRPDGSVITGGQDRAGGPWSAGKPSEGDAAPGSGAECKKVEDDNECLEQCLIGKFAAPRPKYSLALQSLTGGQNCQGWSDTTLAQCQASCKAKR
jgi:YD repeat-containing protein